MHSSHKSNLLYQQLKEGDPTIKKQAENEFYQTSFPEKKLFIIWECGNEAFFYYGHLVSAKANYETELNIVHLYFIRDTLTLKGYNLKLLFKEFKNDDPYILHVIPERYIETSKGDFIIIHATIE